MKNLLTHFLKKFCVCPLAVDLYHRVQVLHLKKVVSAKRKRLEALSTKKASRKNAESLNIVQVSTYDNIGGAAIVAFSLHKAYNKYGNNSTMLVGSMQSKDEKVMVIREPKDDLFLEICKREGLQYWNYLSSFDLATKKEFEESDILHFHNLHGEYFNYLALPGLTKLKPSILTLHDMQSLTGHCAFSLECEKWKTGCGDCPILDAYPCIEKDTTHFLLQGKKNIFSSSDIDIVVPSKWLYDIAKKSILAEKDIHLIYNGIDTTVFRPRLKAKVRKKLDIPPEKIVFITSAAGGTKNPQKGRTYLLEALRTMNFKEDVLLISIGEEGPISNIKGVKWINTGHIFEESAIAEWYCAADIFLYPSIADNCPLVILEAMACGLPVVTFNTGGIPELVRHRETGFVAGYKNIEEFVEGIEFFLNNKELMEDASNKAQKDIEKSFTLDKMTNSYMELYYKVIEKRFHQEECI